MKSIERPSSRWSSRTRLSTAPWIETSSAEVISSAMTTCGPAGERAGERDPLPLAAGELGRAGAGARRVEVDELEQPLRPRLARSARDAPGGIASAMLSPMRHPRVERGVGVLEDHLQRARSRPLVGTGCAVEQDPAARATGARPTAARARVDLPDPDSPTRPTTWPAGTVRLTPSTAVTASRAVADRDVLEAQLAHGRSTSAELGPRRSCGPRPRGEVDRLAGVPAGHPAPGRVGHQRRVLGPAARRRRAGSGRRTHTDGTSAGSTGRPGMTASGAVQVGVHVGHGGDERAGVGVPGARWRGRPRAGPRRSGRRT